MIHRTHSWNGEHPRIQLLLLKKLGRNTDLKANKYRFSRLILLKSMIMLTREVSTLFSAKKVLRIDGEDGFEAA